MKPTLRFAQILLLFLLAALPAQAQSTKLQIGLYWGSFTGSQVTNATTVLSNSKGEVIATAPGAWPTISANLPLDMYTVHVTAPAANGHPALDYTVVLPLASAIPSTTFKVTSSSARFAFNADGKTGSFQIGGGGTF